MGTFTSQDMRDQIVRATDASDGEYDVDAILDDLIGTHGAVDIDTLSTEEFWSVVMIHAEN